MTITIGQNMESTEGTTGKVEKSDNKSESLFTNRVSQIIDSTNSEQWLESKNSDVTIFTEDGRKSFVNTQNVETSGNENTLKNNDISESSFKGEVKFYKEPTSVIILTEEINDADDIVFIDSTIDIDEFSIDISIPQEDIKENEPMVIKTHIFYSEHNTDIKEEDQIELPHALIETGYLGNMSPDTSYHLWLALDESEVPNNVKEFTQHITKVSFDGPVATIYVLLMP